MKKLTEEKLCPTCCGTTFTLCEDVTRYSKIEINSGLMVPVFDHEEANEDCFDPYGPRRLLCIDCGEYLELPKELQP